MDANRKVVSLLFAGSSDGHTIGNQIADVLSTLNVTMCVTTKFVVKDLKDHKDLDNKEKEKPEIKEHKLEKSEIKEKEKPEIKEHKLEKSEIKEKPEIKEHKLEKPEIKEKEKPEIKEHKLEKSEIKEKEKIELSEHKNAKSEVDIGPKITDVPPKLAEIPPTPINPGGQGLEARLGQLEATVGQLATFITAAMRPDLSGGALRQEEDLSALSEQLQQQAAQAAQMKATGDCG
jgi:hypothetical protein